MKYWIFNIHNKEWDDMKILQVKGFKLKVMNIFLRQWERY